MVVTDIHMPYIDGWKLPRMIRSGIFKCSESTPVIMVSHIFTDRITEITAKKFGVCRFIPLTSNEGFGGVVRERCADCLSHYT